MKINISWGLKSWLMASLMVSHTRGQAANDTVTVTVNNTDEHAVVDGTMEPPVQPPPEENTVVTNGENQNGDSDTDATTLASRGQADCIADIVVFNPEKHKKKYLVGVHAIRGFDAAFAEYNMTFAQYLTATAGKRFDPPVEFDMVPTDFQGLFEATEKEEVDFFFANPGVYSCIGVEQGAQPLATVTARLTVRGHQYDLDYIGGVMFTRAGNEEINSILDIKEKVIGAGGIDQITGAQLQFYEMTRAGMSYIMDPKQVVFTDNQFDVVNGVVSGEFDVGFVRTDQIERTLGPDGKPLSSDLFKIIQPRIFVLDDGQLFPYMHSTDIYPEWPVAAMKYVPADVAKLVQEALISMQAHAEAWDWMQAGNNWAPTRCDTSKEVARIASEAAYYAKMAGFRTPRSYFEVRTMHEAAGFILQDEEGNWRCTRADTLYLSVKCPEEHYKIPIEEFDRSCERIGLKCKENYNCYCKPCIKAYEVDVYAFTDEMALMANNTRHDGCAKMSLCGSVEQTKKIIFQAVDNQQRKDATVKVVMHLATATEELEVERMGDYMYTFKWSESRIGVGIMEIFIDDDQIPSSPIRVQVVERRCDVDFPGQKKTSNTNGDCLCSEGTMDISGKCVESTIIAVVISLTAVLFVTIFGLSYLRYRNHKGDQMWLVSIDELQFDDPVEIIGQGSFGVVLLGNYRGTKVALKRAIKTNASGSKHRSNKKGSHGGSKTSNNNTDSVGMSTVGSNDPEDPEAAEEEEEQAGSRGSIPSQGSQSAGTGNSGGHSGGRSGGQSSGRNPHSLGFLAEDFGPQHRFAWLFPWLRQNDYHSRFKETILTTSGHGSSANGAKSWHAILCPWFSAQVRAEEEFIMEMRVLSRLRHPCITTVLGAVISRSHDPMLVMEYMEYGSLHDLLRNETMHLSGEIIMQVCRDVGQGLRFLHSSKPPILHGDMKGRNILIDSRFRAKLCDFGLSQKKSSIITGTPFWLAPEYLRGQTSYTTHCDIYSVGIVIYEIYARQDPYKGEDFRETLRKVCDRRVNKRPAVPDTIPPKMSDIMKKCWSPDPFFRPQAKDLDAALLDMNMRDCEPLDPVDGGNPNGQQKERPTGDMLYQLFPKHVADQLKAGLKVEPENHEEVTIVFSDIIHFTDISKMLSPLKVSQMLDRLYLAFDKVAQKNKVFKVETIGDAYMGVTNLEKKQMDTHVVDAARFAIDLVNEATSILIDEDEPSKGCINIRVGFHVGAVVSNVIGSLNPRYSLFGDAVNVASRMETNSKANRILCSETAAKLLGEQAPGMQLRKRGKIAVKGKGDMTVYWVADDELVRNANMRLESAPGKHVGFVPEEGDSEHADAAVDDKLWRRDLQTGIRNMEDDDAGKTEKTKSLSPAKKTSAPSKPAPSLKSAPSVKVAPAVKKGNIKEAVHVKRGRN